MKSENPPLSTEESLRLIADMIQQAKGNVQGNSFHFLLWGWIIVLANLGHYAILKFTDYPYPFLVWLIALPAYLLTYLRGVRGKKLDVRTHLDKIHTYLWMGFGISIPVIIFFGRQINFNINPLIILMAALPTFLSGVILNFKPLVWGGVFFWISSIVCFLVPNEYQYPLMAVAIVGGYLVPGYLLKKLELSNV
jgi:hypothetical protein